MRQIIFPQQLDPPHSGGVHIGAAAHLLAFHPVIKRFQFAAVACGRIGVDHAPVKGDQDIHLVFRCLQEVFPGVLLDEQLFHGLHQLFVARPSHTAGVVQAVHGEGWLAEIGLVQVQAFKQDIRRRHFHGRQHPVGLQAPIGPKHIPVFLRNAGISRTAAGALDLILGLFRQQVFLQL